MGEEESKDVSADGHAATAWQALAPVIDLGRGTR